MAKTLTETLKSILGGKRTSPADEDFLIGKEEAIETSNSLSYALMGAIGCVGDFYFPPDLIGGCCPRVEGEEQNIVWNAAAEAADTERVHLIWQAKGDKIWYLAVRSSELASMPNTWCPFGSLLPGMKDTEEPPIIYTYFSDETATMMTVLKDGLQIHRGTTSVVRAKAERSSRELDNAPIVELVPDRIQRMEPVPWFSLSLFEERARRVLATLGVLSSIAFGGVAVLIWFVAAMTTVSAHGDTREIREKSQAKSLQMMQTVQTLRSSPMREQVARFAEVNDGLLALNGYLEMYVISGKNTEWRAVIPSNVTAERIKEIGAQMLEARPDGTVVGSSRDALNLGLGERKR